jgi:hypothetical protein
MGNKMKVFFVVFFIQIVNIKMQNNATAFSSEGKGRKLSKRPNVTYPNLPYTSLNALPSEVKGCRLSNRSNLA